MVSAVGSGRDTVNLCKKARCRPNAATAHRLPVHWPLAATAATAPGDRFQGLQCTPTTPTCCSFHLVVYSVNIRRQPGCRILKRRSGLRLLLPVARFYHRACVRGYRSIPPSGHKPAHKASRPAHVHCHCGKSGEQDAGLPVADRQSAPPGDAGEDVERGDCRKRRVDRDERQGHQACHQRCNGQQLPDRVAGTDA